MARVCSWCGLPDGEWLTSLEGLGTATKPAAEFWYLARKPLDGTVAQTVTRWGTGALNIGGCRIGMSDADTSRLTEWHGRYGEQRYAPGHVLGNGRGLADLDGAKPISAPHAAGRWPANVALTHQPSCGDGGCGAGCPVAELDRQSGISKDGVAVNRNRGPLKPQMVNNCPTKVIPVDVTYGGEGGASRFFYVAKPSTREKGAGLDDRNPHPTVKPVELMRWLIRLVTPPDGVVLDPFAGSGTTLVAATLEGFNSIGIEAEADYLPLIEGRVRWAEGQSEQLPLLEAD